MTLSPPELRIKRDRSDRGAVAEETVLSDWRRRRPRRRALIAMVVPLVVLALIAAGIYLVGFSPVLAIKSVRITGEKQLAAGSIAQVAAVPVGAPMARTDVAAIRARVAAIAQVESATVQRSWPHTITIRVVERTAVYAIDRGSSGYLLVDRYGVGFRTAASAGSLPQSEVGKPNQQLLKSVGIVAQALPASLRPKVTRIDANNRDSITLRLKDGDQVFWGSEDQSELKAKVLLPLLKQPGSHYDVSAPGSPAVR